MIAMNSRRHRLWLVALLIPALALGGCSGSTGDAAICPGAETSPIGPNLLRLNFRNAAGSESGLCVRVEGTEQARERGLMSVSKLPDDEGDLFFWPDYGNQDVVIPFWMKDTLIPLTIAFVSADGKVLEEQDMQAESETLHSPKAPYRFAIEANAGWYAKHKIAPDATVDLPAALISLRGR
jgi:uncharacterized membrane protein (UPF0127 family)